jgi:hypothetical protein
MRRAGAVLGLSLPLVLLAHPLAGAASDVWGNVGPASPLGAGGLHGRYPLSHYGLDQHFDAVSASLTGGVDASGVAPMIAYFLASVLWALTSFLANLLVELFAFAFSLDLLTGSDATGGSGALAPVARAIHSIYANVFGAPWLVLAVAVTGLWAMWRALVQRRYAETAGALGLSLIYVVAALFFVAQPAKTVGTASAWTNKMSQSFLAVASHGKPSGGARARDAGAQQLFDLLVFRPWVVLEFGGTEHCARAGTGDEDSDPDSVAVRPLSPDPGRDAALARRLRAGEEVGAGDKLCVNNAAKYAHRFLRHGPGTDERDAEYDALNHGDASRVAEGARGYRLGVADKPATDAMEEGGQYQRLLVAIVVFVGELGAFCLLGALSVGVILAQVLLLLLLAFAPVALVAAAIPGRGHDFFRGWLEKLAGYLLRKAAYSLILAILLAVNGALAVATSGLGWLMSFGLQGLFFWAVFLQRKALTESLVGIATGPRAPGREGTLRVLGLYYGARTVARPLRRAARRSRSGGSAPEGGQGGGGDRGAGPSPAPSPEPKRPAPTGDAVPASGSSERAKGTGAGAATSGAQGSRRGDSDPASRGGRSDGSAGKESEGERDPRWPADREGRGQGHSQKASPTPPGKRQAGKPGDRPPTRREGSEGEAEGSLDEELRADRKRGRKATERKPPVKGEPDGAEPAPRARRKRKRRKGGRA